MGLEIGQKVRVARLRDRVSQDVAEYLGKSGVISDFKMVDGSGVGVVVQFENKYATWFFEDELRPDSITSAVGYHQTVVRLAYWGVMALILTYLGKGGCGSTTLSIATAKRLAHHGRRVLLCIQDSSPGPSVLLGQALPVEPAELSSNLWAMQFHTAALLEQSWEEIKGLEAQYLRTPLLKHVYGQELGVLPGMDGALALKRPAAVRCQRSL